MSPIKKKVTMAADELELAMNVHPPEWTTAPDRVGEIVELDIGAKSTKIKVDGAPSWVVRNDDYVTVVYL